YDIAGFSVGVVEKSKLISGEQIESGDLLIGLSSNGVHSNGFSLIRKVIRDAGLDLQKTYNLPNQLGEELLHPTRIYVKPLLEVIETCEIKGIAHITGGGLPGNIPRMLPESLGAKLNVDSWT